MMLDGVFYSGKKYTDYPNWFFHLLVWIDILDWYEIGFGEFFIYCD